MTWRLKSFSRVLSAILLTAVLCASAVPMAQARLADGPHGQIVICAGASTIVVSVDADGQPVERRHVCPECLVAFALSPVQSTTPERSNGFAQAAHLRHVDQIVRTTRFHPALARDPPVLG